MAVTEKLYKISSTATATASRRRDHRVWTILSGILYYNIAYERSSRHTRRTAGGRGWNLRRRRRAERTYDNAISKRRETEYPARECTYARAQASDRKRERERTSEGPAAGGREWAIRAECSRVFRPSPRPSKINVVPCPTNVPHNHEPLADREGPPSNNDRRQWKRRRWWRWRRRE